MANYISIEELYGSYIRSGQKITQIPVNWKKGSLFFALKGANFNANEFAEKAIENGCSFAVVDEEKYVTNTKIVLVKDVLTALQNLANHHRKTLSIPFLAITGSNGKTTNKELINTVLSKNTKRWQQ